MTFLLLAALSATANAEEVETLTYQLTANGQSVGERTVTVRYLQEEYREVRLLESYTSMSLAVGKGTFAFKQRLGGQGKSPAGTFTSSVSQSDGPKEVQAVRRSEGWFVTIVEPDHLVTETYSHRDIDGTSLTLIDPGAQGYLSGLSRLRVLAAETGTVLDGAIRAGGETSLTLGGTRVSGEVWLWSLAAGDVELVYGEAGHLLRYTMDVAGITVEALLMEAPEARTYGETLEVDGLINVGGIGEESL